ncbi:MAG: adenosine deaminase [Clostridia bacterium]|nr:adenosine deaminase [Clostridia bacterium]
MKKENTVFSANKSPSPCFIDLHLHIDGAISVDTAIELAEMQSIALPTTDRKQLSKLLSVSSDCQDLNEFLQCFALPCSLLQTKEAISHAVYRVQEEMMAIGVLYAELRFAPQLHVNRDLSQQEVVLAALDGLKRSKLKANLILCCMRGDDLTTLNMETVRLAGQYKDRGVVAVDLAGAEALYPTKEYQDIFAYANKLGLNITMHAGEADGAESIRSAVAFGAKRIGHGIHVLEDATLMNELKEKRIPLELCITSNLQTHAVDCIENYPLKKLIHEGLVVTLNSDDPTVCGTNVRKEMYLAKERLQITDDEINQLLMNAVNFSFASDDVKKELREVIHQNKAMWF